MNKYRNERLEESLRIAFVSLVGGILMVSQRWIFENEKIISFSSSISPKIFIRYSYTPAATMVFLVSVLLAVIWYLKALKLRLYFAPIKDTKPARTQWFMFLLFPLLTILLSLYIYGNIAQQALPYLAVFLLFDAIWIFWQATAISTPPILAHVVPLSRLWRSLWRIKD